MYIVYIYVRIQRIHNPFPFKKVRAQPLQTHSGVCYFVIYVHIHIYSYNFFHFAWFQVPFYMKSRSFVYKIYNSVLYILYYRFLFCVYRYGVRCFEMYERNSMRTKYKHRNNNTQHWHTIQCGWCDCILYLLDGATVRVYAFFIIIMFILSFLCVTFFFSFISKYITMKMFWICSSYLQLLNAVFVSIWLWVLLLHRYSMLLSLLLELDVNEYFSHTL